MVSSQSRQNALKASGIKKACMSTASSSAIIYMCTRGVRYSHVDRVLLEGCELIVKANPKQKISVMCESIATCIRVEYFNGNGISESDKW